MRELWVSLNDVRALDIYARTLLLIWYFVWYLKGNTKGRGGAVNCHGRSVSGWVEVLRTRAHPLHFTSLSSRKYWITHQKQCGGARGCALLTRWVVA
jgi:hypothetical protein